MRSDLGPGLYPPWRGVGHVRVGFFGCTRAHARMCACACACAFECVCVRERKSSCACESECECECGYVGVE